MIIRLILSGAMLIASLNAHSELIFEENFDDQPDWATTDRNNLTLPPNWDYGRTDEAWHPSDGDVGSQPSMMINGNNPDQVHGGKGKAFITYSESATGAGGSWDSDGFLWKDFTPSNEVYAKFNIRFQNGWASDKDRGLVKVFRFASYDGSGLRSNFFSDGNSAPIYILDWGQSDYGVRHTHAFRCDDQATNYYCTDPSILDAPVNLNNGSMSVNYTSQLTSTDPKIYDLVNDGFVKRSGAIWHENVWGDIWHTVEIHLKQNSAPGVRDGVFQFWLDGQLIVSMKQIAWIGNKGSMDAKWNAFSIGGNDDFAFNLDGTFSDRERWYAIDNIKVYDELPEAIKAFANFPPNLSGQAKKTLGSDLK